MANIVEMLDELQTRALHEEDIREKLLATRDDSDPLGAFCRACRELGYEIYEMELVCAGEEFHAAMKRSTNGAGRIRPSLQGKMISMSCLWRVSSDKGEGRRSERI